MATHSQLTFVDSSLDKEQHFVPPYVHYSGLYCLETQRENSLNESIPSLCLSDKATDTEDEDDDASYKVIKRPSTLVEPYPSQLNFHPVSSQSAALESFQDCSPQDKQSRFKSAFQQLRGIAISSSTHLDELNHTFYSIEPYSNKNNSHVINCHHLDSVVSADFKPSSRPQSLTDKIKAKFRLKEGRFSSFQFPRSTSSASLQALSRKKYSFPNISKSFPSQYFSPLRQTSNDLDSSQRKIVRFSKSNTVNETYSKSEYDRMCDPDAVCTRLTPELALQIKEELNTFKHYEMHVHEHSRENTHFFL